MNRRSFIKFASCAAALAYAPIPTSAAISRMFEDAALISFRTLSAMCEHSFKPCLAIVAKTSKGSHILTRITLENFKEFKDSKGSPKQISNYIEFCHHDIDNPLSEENKKLVNLFAHDLVVNRNYDWDSYAKPSEPVITAEQKPKTLWFPDA